MRFIGFLVIFCSLFTCQVARGGDAPPVGPSPKDKCPVCGMFVAKYPDFVASIGYPDGLRVFFDGAKDMFKYYFNIQKYHPSRKIADIKDIYVTDYYSLSPTDAHAAIYVIGSDVYGPMGRELIPFSTEEDARVFMKDHNGKKLLEFQEITLPMVKSLD